MSLPKLASDQDLADLADAIISQRVLTYGTVPEASRSMVFLVVAMGGLDTFTAEELEEIFVFAIYGKHATTGMQINGMPMFTECAVWRRTCFLKAVAIARRMHEAREEAVRQVSAGG